MVDYHSQPDHPDNISLLHYFHWHAAAAAAAAAANYYA
jgi:hypothetical protein